MSCDTAKRVTVLCLWKCSESTTADRWIIVDSVMNWYDANQYCADQYGTQLATVVDMEEARAMAEMVAISGWQVWIGMNDITDENVEEWTSGCPW